MKRRKLLKFFHLLIISLLAIGIFLFVKDTKASYSKVLEGTANVSGANISILDSWGNEIGKTTTNDSGYYKIEADIDTNQKYDVKLQLSYDDKKFKCISMNQNSTYEFGEKTKFVRVFNICNIISDVDSNEHQLLADKLRTIGNNVHVGFERNLDNGIQSIGDSLISKNVANVIIYFGNMTDEEREDRRKKDSMSGNSITIIELGTERTADAALKKLAEQEYIKIITNSITIEQDENFAIGKGVIVGENSILDCVLEEVEEIEQPPNLGVGSTAVTISGQIKKGTDLISDLDGKVQLTVKDSNNNVCAGPISLDNSEYSVDVNLDINTNYYIEFQFTEEAFNEGYSTQEYYIEKLGADNNENYLVTKTVNADDSYRRNIICQTYAEIDQAKETDLDTYGENTKLIARTEMFTIDEWINADLTTGVTTNIKSSFYLKEREKVDISLEKNISAVKIVLQDGTVFLEEKGSTIGFVGSGSSAFKMIHMDDELMHGATVYVEYTITANILDDNSIFESVTIRDLLDDAESNGGKLRNIYYDSECKLLTENDKTNRDYNWEVIDDKGNKEVRCTLDKINNTTKIVASQVITQDIEAAYSNSVYIESYKTTTGKRNGTYSNYKRAGETYKNQTIIKSEEVKILPPFGK